MKIEHDTIIRGRLSLLFSGVDIMNILKLWRNVVTVMVWGGFVLVAAISPTPVLSAQNATENALFEFQW